MASRQCTVCGRFTPASWPFELCKACRTTRDDRLLGVDEHGLTVRKSKTAADTERRSQWSGLGRTTKPSDAPVDRPEAGASPSLAFTVVAFEDAREALDRVSAAAKSAGQKPVKRRWWHSVRWH